MAPQQNRKLPGLLGYVESNIFHPRFIKFAVVGLSGVFVNMGILYFLTEQFHFDYWFASIFAIETSILSNFTLNNFWTWGERKKKHLLNRILQYHVSVGITAMLANWLLLVLLTEIFGLYYMVSNLIGIGVGMTANYIINDLWTFKHQQDN